MPKHIVDLLTNLGVSAEEAARIDSLPEADQATFDPKPYTEQVRTNFSTQFQNDPAFFNDLTIEKLPAEVKKKIESAQYGRAANIARDKFLKGLGFNESDIADLTEEEKAKLELFVPKIAEKYAKTKAGDKQLQADLIEARKKLEQYGPDYETTVEQKYQTQAEQKVTAALFDASVISELSSIQGLKIAASDIAKTAKDILQSKYSFERVGDFGVELRQKDNPTMDVLKPNSSQKLTLKEALAEISSERGWIEKKQEGNTGSGTVSVTPGKDGALHMAPHLQDKISAKIAAEK